MIKRFEHQAPLSGAHLPHPEPKAQHGQKPAVDVRQIPEKRSFEPRPGH